MPDFTCHLVDFNRWKPEDMVRLARSRVTGSHAFKYGLPEAAGPVLPPEAMHLRTEPHPSGRKAA